MLNLWPPGGLAGAASRITGAMAKGVAAITMDEEYQQKRREAMNKQPSGLKEGLTRGGKGLVSVRTWVTLLVLECWFWRRSARRGSVAEGNIRAFALKFTF